MQPSAVQTLTVKCYHYLTRLRSLVSLLSILTSTESRRYLGEIEELWKPSSRWWPEEHHLPGLHQRHGWPEHQHLMVFAFPCYSLPLQNPCTSPCFLHQVIKHSRSSAEVVTIRHTALCQPLWRASLTRRLHINNRLVASESSLSPFSSRLISTVRQISFSIFDWAFLEALSSSAVSHAFPGATAPAHPK